MIRTVLVASTLIFGFGAVMAQGDVVNQRKDIMKGVGAATRDGAAIAKGETPFDVAKAQAIFKVYVDAAQRMPSLYPENSKSGDSSASPKVWEDAAGFKAAFAKFERESATAAEASTTVEGFRNAFSQVSRNCGSCHETYRVKR